MRITLLFLITILSQSLFGQVAVLDQSIDEINLNKYCYNISDMDRDLTIEEVMSMSDWDKLPDNGPMFSLSFSAEWIKINVSNPYEKDLERFVFFPYHMLKKVDGYVVNEGAVIDSFFQGIKRDGDEKAIKSRGYNAKINFPANSTTSLFLKLNNNYRFLRAPVFLLDENRIYDVINNTEYLIWLWRGVLLTAMMITSFLFFYLRKRLFSYYFIFNTGVYMYMSSEFGDYIQFFNFDILGIEYDLNHIGVCIAITFLPLFINEMLPLSKAYPRLWKWLSYYLILPWGLSLVNMVPAIQDTPFHTVTMTCVALTSLIFLMIVLVLLLKASIQRQENAQTLFVIYLLYVTGVFLNAYLPNLALIEETPFTFNVLVIGSIIEIISFLYLMGRETFTIYSHRADLLVKQKTFQQEITMAVVKSQETERNKLGRELHDLIGANLSIIKLSMAQDNEASKVLTQTIEVIRRLSHGLVTPKVEDGEFVDEIKELCQLFSNNELTINPFFYEWPRIQNDAVSTHIFRLCQEMFQNAIKHSKANDVQIQFIGTKSGLHIMYEDDGIGFNYEQQRKNGLGLKNIENRVELMKGELEFDTMSGRKGTTIIVEIHDLDIPN